jgi:hypothetical protein
MADDDAPKWSVEEERLLRHETFVAEVLEKRRARDSERRPNPVWQRFLESAGGAALVTVIFGSIAAGLINSLVQEKLRERELALASYEAELKQQQDIATRIVDLVGTSIGAAEDLIILTSQEFDPSRFSGDERKKMIDQRTIIRHTYNSTDTQWRVDQEKLAVLIGLHSYGQSGITEAWGEAQQAVTAYKDCAEEWYNGHDQKFVTSEEARSACGKQKSASRMQLQRFIELMQNAWAKASSVSRVSE